MRLDNIKDAKNNTKASEYPNLTIILFNGQHSCNKQRTGLSKATKKLKPNLAYPRIQR